MRREAEERAASEAKAAEEAAARAETERTMAASAAAAAEKEAEKESDLVCYEIWDAEWLVNNWRELLHRTMQRLGFIF